MAISKIHNLLLGHVAHAVELSYNLLPFNAVDKGIYKVSSTCTVVVQASQILELGVVDHASEKIVVEVALAQFVNLAEHQVANLFQSLSLVRITKQHEQRVIGHLIGIDARTHNLVGLVKVEVHQACGLVLEHA